MTVEGCVNACHAAGFISTPGNAEGLAGLEYGRGMQYRYSTTIDFFIANGII